ncbi:AP2A1 [Bugula neritina]|uniref:AP2A1 n=1 Tax=Bugula neritina TaxID=10212 RepID=A0A7J7J3S9_BUGNE|nr:AP2A1 [Bugula neritina]
MHNFSIKLPVMLSKFSESTVMDSATFFQRWKQLNQNQQECQKIFKATQPIDKAAITQKLIGFGVGAIDSIDPNPDNYVAAAIIHTRAQQIGCLLRLEPNIQAEMYRLTVRSTKELASKAFCELLESQF